MCYKLIFLLHHFSLILYTHCLIEVNIFISLNLSVLSFIISACGQVYQSLPDPKIIEIFTYIPVFLFIFKNFKKDLIYFRVK